MRLQIEQKQITGKKNNSILQNTKTNAEHVTKWILQEYDFISLAHSPRVLETKSSIHSFT